MRERPRRSVFSAARDFDTDVARDFQPLSLVATSDYVLSVHPSLPAKTAGDLLALARAKPGELTYASSGLLGGPHLGGELINLLAKVNIVHIPYYGDGCIVRRAAATSAIPASIIAAPAA